MTMARLYVSNVVQKSFTEVTEKDSKASATTVVVVRDDNSWTSAHG